MIVWRCFSQKVEVSKHNYTSILLVHLYLKTDRSVFQVAKILWGTDCILDLNNPHFPTKEMQDWNTAPSHKNERKIFIIFKYKGFHFRTLASFFMSYIYLILYPNREAHWGGAPHVISGPLRNRIYFHSMPYHGQAPTQNGNKQWIRILILHLFRTRWKLVWSFFKLRGLIFCVVTHFLNKRYVFLTLKSLKKQHECRKNCYHWLRITVNYLYF